MEKCTISKANEFLVFQRQKMNNSLSVLDAKGIILDCAPLMGTAMATKQLNGDAVYQGCLGKMQGIVGGEEDLARATRMVVEVYNPYAALSVVSWACNGGNVEDCSTMADNRDLSIHSLNILHRIPTSTKKEIATDALRRGHLHGLLIRATLSLYAATGPKKGKIVKSTSDLEQRTTSMLRCVDSVDVFLREELLGDTRETKCSNALLSTKLDLLRVLAIINSGLPSTGSDSMEDREKRAIEVLKTKVTTKLREATDSSPLSVKEVCYILPNFVVPLYATFAMCAKICDIYGWGKRKHKSKPCAAALREVAEEFMKFLYTMFDCISKLPGSEDDNNDLSTPTEYVTPLDVTMTRTTMQRCTKARYRTRMRVEPILSEMRSFLTSFVSDDDKDT